jgi:pyruvate ferredoxin oxidoreductase beta subunit
MNTPSALPQDGVLASDAGFRQVLDAYNSGHFEALESDFDSARSIMPPGTGAERDFSYVATEIPWFDATKCVGCMECVNECPDTAILAKVTPEGRFKACLSAETQAQAASAEAHALRGAKYYQAAEKRGLEGGVFSLYVDPSKCKGCGECVDVCGSRDALKMVFKKPGMVEESRADFNFFKRLPGTPSAYITKAPADIMLDPKSLLYVGGAGSCMGCGEGTALRLMLAATGKEAGRENIGIIAATGCNTVFASTYPYNPYTTFWSNSLFENAPTYAMGVRLKWNQRGWVDKKLWVLGGDGAMNDIGFQALSRMMMSGMDIKVLVMDTQVYSNTGGQTSTASFTGQNAKMSMHGSAVPGKLERRKELTQIAMMHPDVYVAQTVAGNLNHFYKCIQGANAHPGPAVVVCYTTCQPEHGVADHVAARQGKLAADSRVFPLMIYDPAKGETFKQRLSLQGNVAMKDDYYVDPKTGEAYDFVHWARTEGRFAKQFDKEGRPSDGLKKVAEDRLQNWRRLQELAGIRA